MKINGQNLIETCKENLEEMCLQEYTFLCGSRFFKTKTKNKSAKKKGSETLTTAFVGLSEASQAAAVGAKQNS